jgi:hypothetical protein
LIVNTLFSRNLQSILVDAGIEYSLQDPGSVTDNPATKTKYGASNTKGDSVSLYASVFPSILLFKTPKLIPAKSDTSKLAPIGSILLQKRLDKLVVKNNFTKNLLSYFISNPGSPVVQSGVQSTSLLNQFSGKRIASIRFKRLHPFGTSLKDTTLQATKWIEIAGNTLHMNTAKSKLRMQLLFNVGEKVNPQLMAENEKLMRDLNYLEDVSFRLEPAENSQTDVNVIVIVKDKFEYAANLNISSNKSDVEIINENMFGLGHRFNVGMAQRNRYLPEMGLYLSYHVNNIFGKFINATIGFSDTYMKKNWNFLVEKNFLTTRDENAGGLSFDHVSKLYFITENHPIELDTAVSFQLADIWYAHAFPGSRNTLNKTTLSFRYFHQDFNHRKDYPFETSEFSRDHDFFLTGLSFSRRNLYKNNLVYGYGVTEDIPYGHNFSITAGIDKSQFGIWPYWGLSINKAFVAKGGSYFSGRFSVDGFLLDKTVRQGTVLLSGQFFSKKFYAFGDPLREFIKIEFLDGINRLREEHLTIDGRFGIRDFYTNDLKGNCRLNINLETVRYLKWNVYGFRFTNYLFTDFAFLSDKAKTIFSDNFYAGVGTGLRIYNQSLVFKIIDVRLSWFPVVPPEGISHFGTNLQGLTKSRFDDFLGKKPELIRYQ